MEIAAIIFLFLVCITPGIIFLILSILDKLGLWDGWKNS